jgi:hypothetical protein
MKIRWILTLVFASSLIVPFISPDADARGGRGGGFSRGGAASSGGFSGGAGRANRQAGSREANRQAGSAQHQDKRQDWNNDNREDRQDWKDDNREDRQDYGRDRQDDRQDFIDDEHDDNWDHHHNDWDDGDFAAGVVVGGVMVGAAAASRSVNQVTYVTTLPCQATAVSVGGVSYYKCSSSWYQRGYAGSQVTYIQVAAPPGF